MNQTVSLDESECKMGRMAYVVVQPCVRRQFAAALGPGPILASVNETATDTLSALTDTHVPRFEIRDWACAASHGVRMEREFDKRDQLGSSKSPYRGLVFVRSYPGQLFLQQRPRSVRPHGFSQRQPLGRIGGVQVTNLHDCILRREETSVSA